MKLKDWDDIRNDILTTKLQILDLLLEWTDSIKITKYISSMLPY